MAELRELSDTVAAVYYTAGNTEKRVLVGGGRLQDMGERLFFVGDLVDDEWEMVSEVVAIAWDSIVRMEKAARRR